MTTAQHTTSALTPFQFGNHPLSIITHDNGEPWFIAKEVCDILGNREGLHKNLSQELFSIFDMLAIASSLDEKKMSWGILSVVSRVAANCPITTQTFWEMYGCTARSIAWAHSLTTRKPDEFYWHKVFRKHLAALIPGAILVKNKSKKGAGVPDFFVKTQDGVCPVEVKRERFTLAACRQLKGYMQDYEAVHGFAVSQKLATILYKNMTFISLEGLGS